MAKGNPRRKVAKSPFQNRLSEPASRDLLEPTEGSETSSKWTAMQKPTSATRSSPRNGKGKLKGHASSRKTAKDADGINGLPLTKNTADGHYAISSEFRRSWDDSAAPTKLVGRNVPKSPGLSREPSAQYERLYLYWTELAAYARDLEIVLHQSSINWTLAKSALTFQIDGHQRELDDLRHKYRDLVSRNNAPILQERVQALHDVVRLCVSDMERSGIDTKTVRNRLTKLMG